MEMKRKEIHTYVARGRDVSLGIREFTIWCEFYSMKKKTCYRKRGYIIEKEDKNKEKPLHIKNTIYVITYFFPDKIIFVVVVLYICGSSVTSLSLKKFHIHN